MGFMSEKSVMSDGFMSERSVLSDSFSCLVEVLMSDKVGMSGRGDMSELIVHVWGWLYHRLRVNGDDTFAKYSLTGQ